MDCYFSRQLDNVNLKLVERQQTDRFKMTNHQVFGYHNNIESTLLLRTQNFGGTDTPSKKDLISPFYQWFLFLVNW